MESKTIIIADKSKNYRNIIKNLLSEVLDLSEYDVEFIATLKDLLVMLGGITPRLIVTEYHFPDGDIIEALDFIKRIPRLKDVPVVIVTSDTTNASIQRVRFYSIKAYLIKPLDPQKFKTAISAIFLKE